MRLFHRLHLRRFFEHRVRTLLSIGGVAIGGALVVSVLGLFGSLTGSVLAFVEDLAGAAHLEVAGVADEGFDERIFFKIESAPGVKTAAPMVRSQVLMNERKVLLVGVDERITKIGSRVTQVDEAQRPDLGAFGIYLGKPLADEMNLTKGSSIRLISTAGVTTQTVAGVVEGDAARINEGRFAAAPLPLAQQILGKIGRLDSIFVVAADERELEPLRRRLSVLSGPEASVDSPAKRAEQAKATTRGLRFGMLMGVTMALVVGAFLVYNTMSMAALERRRELATLRALGGRRRVLLRMFLLEAAVLGLIGSAIGAAVGVVVSQRLVAAIPDFFTSAIGIQLGYHLPGFAVPAALLAGAAVSAVAAWFPAAKAVRVPPADAMRPEGTLESLDAAQGVAVVPSVFGFGMMVGGFAIAVRAPSSLGYFGLGALMAGSTFASYGMTGPITRATARIARRFGVPGRLAAAAVERSPRRAWASSVAVVTAVGMVVAQTGITQNLNDSLAAAFRTLGIIDLYVSAEDGSSFGADVLLPGQWREQLDELPGVAHVGTSTFSFVTFRRQRILVQGVSGSIGAEPAMAGVSPQIRDEVEAGEGAIVSKRFTELYGLGVGETLRLPTPTGVREIEVVGSVPSFTWERGLVTIGRVRMQEWFGRTGVSDFLISFEDGADPVQVREQVESFVAASASPVYLNSGSQYLEVIMVTVGQINALFNGLAGVVIVAAILAILNALLISVLERRRELGIMRALGTSRRQLRRMVAVEAAALGVVGGVIGVLLGFVAHRASITAIGRQGGIAIDYGFVAMPALFAFALGLTMAVLGSIEPARRAASVNIIEAIGYE